MQEMCICLKPNYIHIIIKVFVDINRPFWPLFGFLGVFSLLYAICNVFVANKIYGKIKEKINTVYSPYIYVCKSLLNCLVFDC